MHGRDRARCLGAEAGRADPGDRRRPGCDAGPRHGERVACIVLHAVVIEEAAPQPVTAKRGREVEGIGPRQASVPAAVVPGAQDVVQRETGVVERLRRVWDAVDREEEGLDRDEMRRELQ